MGRYLRALMAMMVAFSMLCGCSAIGKKEPKIAQTAQEVVAGYNSLGAITNVKTDISVDLSMSFWDDEYAMDVPVKFVLSLKSFDESHRYGVYQAEATIFGIKTSSYEQIYVEDGVRYISEDEVWYIDDEVGVSSLWDIDLNEEAFKNATLKYNEDEGMYIVKQSYADYLSYDTMEDLGELTGSMTDSFGIDTDEIEKMLTDVSVIYTFDSGYRLMSIRLNGFDYTGPVESEDSDEVYNITYKLDMSILCSKYGEIEKSEVLANDLIKASAVKKTYTEE